MKKRIISAFLTATIMAGCMSFVMSLFNIGWNIVLLNAWLKGWFIGSVFVFPLALFLPPVILRFVNTYVK